MSHFHLSGSTPKPWQPSSSLLDRKFTHPCLCRVTLPCSVSVFICPLPCSSTAELLLSGSATIRDFSSSLGFGDRPSRRTGIIYTAWTESSKFTAWCMKRSAHLLFHIADAVSRRRSLCRQTRDGDIIFRTFNFLQHIQCRSSLNTFFMNYL